MSYSHWRCPTSNIPNRPTPAPRDKSSPDFPLLSLERPSELPLILTDTRPGPSDFQSNGLGYLDFELSGSTFVPSVAGLGFSYDLYTSENIHFNAAGEAKALSAASSRPCPISPSGSTDSLECHPGSLFDENIGLFESFSFGSNYSGLSSQNDTFLTVADSLSQYHLNFQYYEDSAPRDLESISDQIVKAATHHTDSGSHSSLSSFSDLPSSEDLFLNFVAKYPYADLYPYPVWSNHGTDVHSVPNVELRCPFDNWNEPPLAVNPADITMAGTTQEPDVDYSYILFSPDPEALCLPQSSASDPSLPDDEPADEEHRSPNLNSDIYVNPDNAAASSDIGGYYSVYPVDKSNKTDTSDYETSGPESSPFPSPRKKRARKSNQPIKKSQATILPVKDISTDVPLAKAEPLVKGEPMAEDAKLEAEDINFGTPVFDAHRGIDLNDLKCKAARYRQRNRGREYDNAWLVSFAGKLSAQGELLDDFRCYVLGCDQVNKRRDHILIHVGAHLDQRPFQCRYW